MAIVIIVRGNEDQVDNRPNAETSAREQLENADPNITRVKAMNTKVSQKDA